MALFIPCLWHYAGFLERAAVDLLGESDVIAAIRNIVVTIYFVAPLLLLKLSSHFGGDGGASLAGLLDSADKTAEESANSGVKIAKAGANIALRVAGR